MEKTVNLIHNRLDGMIQRLRTSQQIQQERRSRSLAQHFEIVDSIDEICNYLQQYDIEQFENVKDEADQIEATIKELIEKRHQVDVKCNIALEDVVQFCQQQQLDQIDKFNCLERKLNELLEDYWIYFSNSCKFDQNQTIESENIQKSDFQAKIDEISITAQDLKQQAFDDIESIQLSMQQCMFNVKNEIEMEKLERQTETERLYQILTILSENMCSNIAMASQEREQSEQELLNLLTTVIEQMSQ